MKNFRLFFMLNFIGLCKSLYGAHQDDTQAKILAETTYSVRQQEKLVKFKAAIKENEGEMGWPARKKLIKTLIEDGIDVNDVAYNNKIPLWEAVMHQDENKNSA